MFKRLYRLVLLFLVSILVVVSISACSKTGDTSTKPNSSSSTENCRVIQHAMGETCVPKNPQRIVVLDSMTLESTLALNQKPIGSPLKYAPSTIPTTDIVDLGGEDAISVERVLALKPDLILGETYSAPAYSQLSQIAPTVLIKFNHSGEWKEHFAFVGEVLGKSEAVERVMTDYYQRAKEFQQKINGDTEVSIVRIYPTQITVYTKAGFPGTILEDAGLSRPPSQDLDLEQTKALEFSPIQYPISKEVIDKADGDAVFVVVDDWHEKNQNSLTSLMSDPLWLKLDAFKQGKVYEVPDYWIGGGIFTANAVLDDLFKYLVPLRGSSE